MTETKVTILIVVGLVALGAFAIYDDSKRPPPPTAEALRAEAERAERHRKSMDKWYAENPNTDAARINSGEDISAATTEGYLDSRTGAALERTLKRVIDMAGQRCDRIRQVQHMDAADVIRLGAQDGRSVDCNEDGIYWVLESADGFRAVKR